MTGSPVSPPVAPYEDVRSEIQNLLEFTHPHNPDPEEPSEKLVNVPFLPFHERHLPKELSLKAVKVIPLMRQDIMGVFEKVLATFDAEKPCMPSVDWSSEFPRISKGRPPRCDARDIASAYVGSTGSFAPSLASTFLLHRDAPSWSTILGWQDRDANLTLSCNVFNEDYSVVLRGDDSFAMPTATCSLIEPETASLLRSAESRNPQLRMWHVFSTTPETERLFRDLDGIALLGDFPLIRPGTIGGHTQANVVEPSKDARQTPWGVPMSAFANAHNNPSQFDCTNFSKNSVSPNRDFSSQNEYNPEQHLYNLSPQASDVWLPQALAPGTQRRATPASILQHAWYRAVELDATFIVLHSVSFQRIGFRHRQSQTLFLTDPINPSDSEHAEAYNKLHIGLFMCILLDVLDRERQIIKEKAGDVAEVIPDTREDMQPLAESDPKHQPSLGKPETEPESLVARQVLNEDKMKVTIADGNARSLLLVRFQEGLLQSPAPSSFVRVGTKFYEGSRIKPACYMTLTLTSRIATGATGDVHKATLAFSDNQPLRFDVVVKLGYKPLQRRRMKHEGRVYEHLHESGVKGIPKIFGLFQDVETRTLMMMMEDVGESIAHQEHRGARPRNEFSEEESRGFMAILNGIHNASVCHGDIRPINLTSDEERRVFIIDFDRAQLGASKIARRDEASHLHHLLHETSLMF